MRALAPFPLPLALACLAFAWASAAPAAEPEALAPPPPRQIVINNLKLAGAIEGENITFTLSFDAETKAAHQDQILVAGDAVLVEVSEPAEGYAIRYDAAAKSYYMIWPHAGARKVSLSFAARPALLEKGPWREATFAVPASRVRELEVACDRADLEVLFPNAMRVTREVKEDAAAKGGKRLVVTALQGPGKPFAVRWKPQVGELDAKLVLSTEANVVATARVGSLRLDALYVVDIAQGKLTELAFAVPKSLSVTQVRGGHIRDWRIDAGADAQTLRVVLNRPQTKQYAVQVQAEAPLPKFPGEIDLPVLVPEGGIRAGGFLSVGTDSAIRMVVRQSGGLSQTDASAFPRILLDRAHPRLLPKNNAFFYQHATTPYQMRIALDDIVPTYDATSRLTVRIKEEDLTVEAEVELDVRDAPVRQAVVEIPAGFSVAAVTGPAVEDHAVREAKRADGTAAQEIEIRFRQPVQGRTLVGLRLELGKGPLGAAQRFGGLAVRGAKSERGYVVVAAEEGIQIDPPQVRNLREVHTGSVPMRVAQAQLAYRYREPGWSLELTAREKPAGIRAEAFHLTSLGEGMAYGNVVTNYYITGAPVDEFRFRVADGLQNVEFVGGDVQRWTRDKDLWSVKLRRKVIGDYNLSLSYTQRWEEGGTLQAGGVSCAGVETQSGFLVLASRMDLRLTPQGALDPGVLEIDRDELPGHYRWLVHAPVLKTYKYVEAPHRVALKVDAYKRGALLPAVVEIMEMRTDVAVPKSGEAESETRIRYEVKNASSQHLTLALPEGAEREITTHVIEKGADGQEKAVRVPSAVDRGQLKIPIERRRNPNDPVTIELRIRQVHGRLAGSGRFALAAPRCRVRSTFAAWDVVVPAGWAILPASGGNMVAEDRALGAGSLDRIASRAIEGWKDAIDRFALSAVGFVYVLASIAICALVFFLRRAAAPAVAAALLLLAFLLTGIAAGADLTSGGDLTAADNLSAIRFTRALSLDEETPLAIAASLAPAWKQYATPFGSVVMPILALAGLALAAAFRRLRAAGSALALACALYAAAQFPNLGGVVGHALTWGVPALLIVAVACRRLARSRGFGGLDPAAGRAATAALLLGLGAALLAGCGGVGPGALPPGTMCERVECTLQAGKDSMDVRLRLKARIEKPSRFPLLEPAALLLSPEEPAEHVRLVSDDGQYYIRFEREGTYEVDVQFLVPLPEAGEDQGRRFRMPVPPALTNRVRLTIPSPAMDVESPNALRLTREEREATTAAEAILGPGDDAVFLWRPRARQTRLEKTAFYAEVTSLVRFDAGLAEGRHRLRFQIAQGELKEIRVRMPAEVSVTSVEGAGLGAWRFDPARRELEAHLAQPATGEYALSLATQIARSGMPYTAALGALDVPGALRVRAATGLAASSAVFLAVRQHSQPANVDDFAREAADLVRAFPGLQASDIHHAYRGPAGADRLEVEVNEVRPEVRVTEDARFVVADDRLVYNGQLAIEIAKAGVFAADLRLPAKYDIDALGAPEVSHWDDATAGEVRAVQVHFKQKLMGTTVLKLALSRPEAELPKELAVPRVEVAGAIKHVGQIVLPGDRAVRLSAAARKGVSELNPVELNERTPGALAFRLLRPDWQLSLRTELVEPRVTADFLHVAQVTDGLVRHRHFIRYHLYNAGVKIFEVEAPKGALGLTIAGPEIARSEESPAGSGRWRIELTRKWFDRPYPLQLAFETQFDRAGGEVRLAPVKILGTDLQRGHAVVRTTERVELKAVPERTTGATLQPAEARLVPARPFGAEDLSDAAFCYSSAATDYVLAFKATRHEAAPLLEANVLATLLTTVVAENGESIHRVQLKLQVGSKPHLETRLPDGAAVWALLVNGRSTLPSRKPAEGGGDVVLIPLAHAAAGEMAVDIELTYVLPAPAAWRQAAQAYVGPRFDLPLKNVAWRFLLPSDFDYGDFGGNLNENAGVTKAWHVQQYGIRAYETLVKQIQVEDNKKANRLIQEGNRLAQQGQQREAKQALESAQQYSVSDPALNEDARVQLNRLKNQQAVVGLVGRRGRLRGQAEGKGPAPAADLGDQFNQADAERLQNSLSKADSDNLQRITERMIEMQEAAAGTAAHLTIVLPARGRLLEFARPLMAKTNAEMTVSFAGRPVRPASAGGGWGWTLGLFAVFAVLLGVVPRAGAAAGALGRRLASSPAAPPAGEAAAPASPKPEPHDEPPSQAEPPFDFGGSEEKDDEDKPETQV